MTYTANWLLKANVPGHPVILTAPSNFSYGKIRAVRAWATPLLLMKSHIVWAGHTLWAFMRFSCWLFCYRIIPTTTGYIQNLRHNNSKCLQIWIQQYHGVKTAMSIRPHPKPILLGSETNLIFKMIIIIDEKMWCTTSIHYFCVLIFESICLSSYQFWAPTFLPVTNFEL